RIIIFGQLGPVLLGIYRHASVFVDVKGSTVNPDPFLLVENRSFRGKLGDQGQENEKGSAEDQYCKRKADIKSSFYDLGGGVKALSNHKTCISYSRVILRYHQALFISCI